FCRDYARCLIQLAHARASPNPDPGFGIWQSPAAGYAYLFGPSPSSIFCCVQVHLSGFISHVLIESVK
ncbi:hypothetical protein KSS87_007959, partial [Heliosperma pusillum]